MERCTSPSMKKNRIRFLQTGDLHIGAGRAIWGQEEVLARGRFLFEALLATAIAEDCAAILITGDVFDAKTVTVEERELVTHYMLAMAKQLPVYMISGNHDLLTEGGNSHVNLFAVLSENNIPNLFVASTQRPSFWELAPGLTVIGASCSLSESQSWVDNFAATLPANGQYIFMGHATVRGCTRNDKGWRPRNDDRALTLADASLNTSVIYWAYGDIHLRQPLPTLGVGANGWYAGSPIQINFGEDTDRGCLIVALDNNDGQWAYRGKKYRRLDDKEFNGFRVAPLCHVTTQEQLDNLPSNALVSLAAGLVLTESQRDQVVKNFRVVVDSTLPDVQEQNVLMLDGQIVAFDPLVSPVEEVEQEVMRDGDALSEAARQELRKIVTSGVERFRNRSYLT